MTDNPARSAEPAIHIRGLVKRFGAFTALDDLDLSVARGEVHGFLGPNGAGKSTTIRVLLGLLRANAGTIRLLGGDPWRDVVELHRRLAYVPGDVVLWPALSGGEAIDLLGNLRGGLNPARRAELIERFELDPTKRGRQYSKGNRQKVAIVAALAADVELLILDEPTSGLDPLMEAVFQDEILADKAQGRTILLSSHIMSEVEALADRVSIIRQGRIVQSGTLEDLRGQTRISIVATLADPPIRPVRPHDAARRPPGPAPPPERHRRAGAGERRDGGAGAAPDDRADRVAGVAGGPLPAHLRPVALGAGSASMSATLTGRLTGTRPLLAVSLRQDARNIAPWVLLISVLSVSSVLAYAWVFPDPADRAALAATLGANPALSLIFGPARDLSTADGFNAWRAGALGAFFAGLMSILIVVRNSRANEDSGQAELLASSVLARQSRLAVALLMAALASLALGVVCFLLTVLAGGGLLATLLLSATFAASGLMFAGVAAVAAQLGSDARTASSIAVATLGICYVLRGYLDSSGAPDWATWLTPLGWLEKVAPATDDNPWPLLPALALALLLVGLAFALQSRRDFGQGMIATRPGPADAGLAGNVWGFALTLHRPAIIAWLIAFTGLGVLFGNLASSVGDLITANPAMAAIIASGAASPADFSFAFLVTIQQIVAIVAAVMGVQIVLRLHAEEIDFRVEPLLAGSLRRTTYLASNAVVAYAGPALGLVVAGLGMGLVASAQDESIAMLDVVKQALVTIPATWTLVALALAAVGAAPSKRLVAWVGVVATFGLTILGPTFNLPDWALDLSPLRHVPNVTAASPDWVGLVWLSGIVVLLSVVGFAGFRRRDIQ